MNYFKFDFKGIGTTWWIIVYEELKTELQEELTLQVKSIVSNFELLYSRFLDDSVLTKLNKNKVLKNAPFDLLEMIKIGLKVNILTQGYFNIAVGKLLDDMGYDKNYSFINKNNDPREFEDQISLINDTVLLGNNTVIDLGGIGKGYLIDKVNCYIKSKVKYYYINAGGDIYSTTNNNKPIEFVLENPFNNKEAIGTIKIKNESLASSSPSKRYWIDLKTKKKFHHLINVKNKSPQYGIAGVFTLGKNALNADIASTALFVSPKDCYINIAKELNIEYLIIFDNSTFLRSENYNAELYLN